MFEVYQFTLFHFIKYLFINIRICKEKCDFFLVGGKIDKIDNFWFIF